MNLIYTICIIFSHSLPFIKSQETFNLIEREIYYIFPKQAIIYCKEYSNSKEKLGCLNNPNGNTGILKKINNITDLSLFIATRKTYRKYIVVLDNYLYLDINFMRRFLLFPSLKESINGIVIFAPKANSRRVKCEKWVQCGFGKPEYQTLWPFSIIIIREAFQEKINECLTRTKSDESCSIEIRSPQHQNVKWIDCLEKRSGLNYKNYVVSDMKTCEIFTGTNHYFGIFNKPINGKPIYKTFIIMFTRQDTTSMFEGAAYGSINVLPSVSILMNMLHEFFSLSEEEQEKLLTRMDYHILIAFVDNDSNSFSGTIQLYYDLKAGNIKFGDYVFQMDYLLYSVELGRFVTKQPFYYMLAEPDTFRLFWDTMSGNPKKIFKVANFSFFINYENINDSVFLLPELKILLIRDHTVRLPGSYPSSFEDINTNDLAISRIKTFARQLLKLTFYIDNSNSTEFAIKFYECMVIDYRCDLLFDYISPEQRIYLDAMANPFQCQYSTPENINGVPVSARLSDIISLIALTNFGVIKKGINSTHCQKGDEGIKINGVVFCYRLPYIKLTRNAVLNYTFKTPDGKEVKQEIYEFQPTNSDFAFTRLYVVSDNKVEVAVLVFGTILMALSFVGIIFLKSSASKLVIVNY